MCSEVSVSVLQNTHLLSSSMPNLNKSTLVGIALTNSLIKFRTENSVKTDTCPIPSRNFAFECVHAYVHVRNPDVKDTAHRLIVARYKVE